MTLQLPSPPESELEQARKHYFEMVSCPGRICHVQRAEMQANEEPVLPTCIVLYMVYLIGTDTNHHRSIYSLS